MLKKLFANRSKRFYIELCSGIVGIIASIIFFIVERNVAGASLQFEDTSLLTFIFVLVGGVISIVDAFIRLPLVGILPCVAYGYSIGNHIRNAAFILADVTEPVAFFTGSVDKANSLLNVYIPFLVIFVLVGIASIVACFLGEKKKELAKA